jgi:hypothetical protein
MEQENIAAPPPPVYGPPPKPTVWRKFKKLLAPLVAFP